MYNKKLFTLFFTNILFIFLIAPGFAQNRADLKSEIYPKLKDRRCSNMTLDKCNCPDAREMKAYIEALIEAGMSKEEIFYRVGKKFSLNTILDKEMKAAAEKRLIKEAGKLRPEGVLEMQSFDFGQVNKKQGKITKNIKLYNKGNKDLIIKNIRASCSCTSVSLSVGDNKSSYFGSSGAENGWQMVIPAGKEGNLEIVLDVTHPAIKPGKVVREIFIESNDPLYPELSVTISAQVSE